MTNINTHIFTICPQCDRGNNSRWLCKTCADKCHNYKHGVHNCMPFRNMQNIICECVCDCNKLNKQNKLVHNADKIIIHDPRYDSQTSVFSHKQESSPEIASYHFFDRQEYNKTNMSGKNLTPSGLTILSIQDNNIKGTVVGNFSLTYLLALLYKCSSGSTENELRKMLGVGNVDSATLFSQIQDINDSIAIIDTNNFSTYSAILFTVPIRKSFSKICTVNNISVIPAEEWHKVNNKVSQMTNNLIRQILTGKDTVITNAFTFINVVYFKSKWKHTFKIKDTKPELFNNNRLILMMQSTNDCAYMNIENIGQLLELEYTNNVFCMGFLLPSYKFTLGQFTDIDHSAMKVTSVKYSIPKFTHITNDNNNLTNGYIHLGIKQLFRAPELPFISSDTGNCIIIHKAIIIVDEQGTDSTKNIVNSIALAENCIKHKPIVFKLDTPFYYYIRHKISDTIVLMGHFM